MEAVVMAGGKGSRLQPMTAEIPKPLVTVGDRPILDYLLRGLARHGVTKVHLAVNHLAHLVEAYVDDGRSWGLDVAYCREDTPLGTVGPLRAIPSLPEQFLVANGDILTDLDFARLSEFHREQGADLSIAVHQRVNDVDYGVLDVNDLGAVVGFREKPSYRLTVSMGIYVFSRTALELIPPDGPFGFDELVLKMLHKGRPMAAYPFDGYWLDVGRPEDYGRAQRDADRLKSLLG